MFNTVLITFRCHLSPWWSYSFYSPEFKVLSNESTDITRWTKRSVVHKGTRPLIPLLSFSFSVKWTSLRVGEPRLQSELSNLTTTPRWEEEKASDFASFTFLFQLGLFWKTWQGILELPQGYLSAVGVQEHHCESLHLQLKGEGCPLGLRAALLGKGAQNHLLPKPPGRSFTLKTDWDAPDFSLCYWKSPVLCLPERLSAFGNQEAQPWLRASLILREIITEPGQLFSTRDSLSIW